MTRSERRNEVITPTQIEDAVRNVLHRTDVFMSAYQILEELPADLRDQIIHERGRPGQGSGHHYAAATVVAQAAEKLVGRENIVFVNAKHLKFEVAGDEIRGGNPACAFYRLPA